jgi:hypothetical protein
VDWVVEPEIKNYAQRLGLVRFPEQYFERLNSKILASYTHNIRSMIALAQYHHIPIVFITPISNLEATPYGIGSSAEEIYLKGLAERNISKRTQSLRKAKDLDIFSGHQRAKSPLLDFLRSLNESGAYTLDIETALDNQGFLYSYSDFYDYVHMRNNTHQRIAHLLADFLEQHSLS